MIRIETPDFMSAADTAHEDRAFTVFSVRGNLTVDRVPAVETFFLRAIASGRRDFVLDGDGLTYVSSTGFGLLLHVCNLLRDRGGDLKLANLSPAVGRSLRLLSLSRYLDVWPKTQDALCAFERAVARFQPSTAALAA